MGLLLFPNNTSGPVPDTFDSVFDDANALIEPAAPRGADRRQQGTAGFRTTDGQKSMFRPAGNRLVFGMN
jgi:hypothetical protein